MWIFYFLLWTAVRASAEEPLYKKIGDEVVLTPDSVENPITNIRWKHDDNIAMQWYGDETSSYRQFKDRGSLNISTGVMTITGLTPDLSGIYTAEINGKVNSETELLVISPVPKPNLTVSCERTYCVFTCSGNITDTEPVTYWWTAGGKRWNSTKELRITKEEKKLWFSCTLENPVSSISSEKVFNPFMEIISDKTSVPVSSAFKVPLAVCIIIIIISIIISIIIYLRYKYKKDLQSLKPQWQYAAERSGDWCDFKQTRKCAVTSDNIEKQHKENPNGKMLLTGEYELDFKAMTKTNLKTRHVRKIRRVLLPPESPPAVEVTSSQNTTSAPETSHEAEMRVMLPVVRSSNQNQTSVVTRSNINAAGFKPQWQFKRRRGGWGDFRNKRGPLNKCSVTNDDIQKWYQEKPHDKMPHTVEGENCELDFDEMIQTNLKTGDVRKIRFVIVPTEHFRKALSAAFRQRGYSAVSEINETPAQDLEAAEALNPNNDTEKPASPPAVEETSTQITTSAPETRNETE